MPQTAQGVCFLRNAVIPADVYWCAADNLGGQTVLQAGNRSMFGRRARFMTMMAAAVGIPYAWFNENLAGPLKDTWKSVKSGYASITQGDNSAGWNSSIPQPWTGAETQLAVVSSTPNKPGESTSAPASVYLLPEV